MLLCNLTKMMTHSIYMLFRAICFNNLTISPIRNIVYLVVTIAPLTEERPHLFGMQNDLL